MFLSTTVYMATLRKYRDFIKLRLEFIKHGPAMAASTSKQIEGKAEINSIIEREISI